MVLERRDTHYGTEGKGSKKKDLSSVSMKKKSYEDIEGNPNYDAKKLREGLLKREEGAFQSLAIHSCISTQLKMSPVEAMRKLEDVAEASSEDSLLDLIKSDEKSVLVGFYLKPQQTLNQIFREFGQDNKYSYLRGVRTAQLAGMMPSRKKGAEKDLYNAIMKMDKILLAIEYAGIEANEGKSSGNVREFSNELKTSAEKIYTVIMKILNGEYEEVVETFDKESGPPGRITSETMKERLYGK